MGRYATLKRLKARKTWVGGLQPTDFLTFFTHLLPPRTGAGYFPVRTGPGTRLRYPKEIEMAEKILTLKLSKSDLKLIQHALELEVIVRSTDEMTPTRKSKRCEELAKLFK